MRAASIVILGGALAALLWLAAPGTLFGLAKAAQEIRQAPAAIAGIALVVLIAGPAALPRAGAGMLLGAAGGVALRAASGTLGADGWIPGEAVSRAESLIEAGWLLVFALFPEGRTELMMKAMWIGAGVSALLGMLAVMTGVAAIIAMQMTPGKSGMGRAIFGILAGLVGGLGHIMALIWFVREFIGIR